MSKASKPLLSPREQAAMNALDALSDGSRESESLRRSVSSMPGSPDLLVTCSIRSNVTEAKTPCERETPSHTSSPCALTLPIPERIMPG